MNKDEERGEKPTTATCRLRALIRWTDWSYKEIEMLVEEGRLRTLRFKPNSRLRYIVASAQAILDGKA